jgi:hypothetical protein
LGKVLISKSFEFFDEMTDEDKRMLRVFDLNEMAFTELVMFIQVQNYFRGNNGREWQCHDREKGWQVTMWNPTEKWRKAYCHA